jgi:hypothetical protein
VGKRTLLAYAVPFTVAALVAAMAQAQTSTANNTRPNPITNTDGSVTIELPPFNSEGGVFYRARPKYDPLGLRLGSFVALPSVSVGTIYNSNVFNTPSATKADWALEVMPTLRLISDLPRHALSLLMGAHSLFYDRLTSENTIDVTVSGQGRLDIRRSTNVVVEGGYDVLHENRGAPDLPGNAAEPTEYAVANVQATLNQSFNRLQVSVGASLQHLDYRNTKLTPLGLRFLTIMSKPQLDHSLRPGCLRILAGLFSFRARLLQ